MTTGMDPRYELTLACGDTVSSNVLPRIGAYRMCIHCDQRYRVTGIRDTRPASMAEPPAPAPVWTAMRETAYGYSSAYGYAAQQLEFIKAECERSMPQEITDDGYYGSDVLVRILDMANRGISEANAALRRYDSRIEEIEEGAQSSDRATFRGVTQ